MLRHESLRAVIRLTWPEAAFQQVVMGLSSESLSIMNKFITDHPDMFKFGIPYSWEHPWDMFLEQGIQGAVLLDDLTKRIEGDEPIKP